MTLDPLLARVLVRRYGMDGRGPRSLERVARELRLDRGDLRSIEGALLGQLRRLARRRIRLPSAQARSRSGAASTSRN